MNIINYVFGAILLAGIVAGGLGFYKYNSTIAELSELKTQRVELQKRLTAQSNRISAFQQAERNNEFLALERDKNAQAISNLNRSVVSLRATIKDSERIAASSQQACNSQLSITGKVFGECTDRYTEVAGKAQELQSGYKALDRHVGILTGIISNLQPIGELDAKNYAKK